MFVPRNDVESKVNSTYFYSEDGAFHWHAVLSLSLKPSTNIYIDGQDGVRV